MFRQVRVQQSGENLTRDVRRMEGWGLSLGVAPRVN